MSNNNNYGSACKSAIVVGTIIVTVCVFLYGFIKNVINAGRLKEFFITTPILLAIWFMVYCRLEHLVYFNLIDCAIGYGIPLGVYAIYWFILLTFTKKITCDKANPNWANEDWWWSLNGWQFEEEVARVFRLNGFKAKVTQKTGDGGIDIVMYKGKYKYIVQCKHYRDEVPVEPIRALNGVKEDFGADILIVVASSGITKAGRNFIKNKPYFKLVTLDDIIRMGLRPYKGGKESTEENNNFKEDTIEIENISTEGINKALSTFRKL